MKVSYLPCGIHRVADSRPDWDGLSVWDGVTAAAKWVWDPWRLPRGSSVPGNVGIQLSSMGHLYSNINEAGVEWSLLEMAWILIESGMSSVERVLVDFIPPAF